MTVERSPLLTWVPEDGVDLVIPVKHRGRAKTRLPAPAGVDHGALALAFALDTIEAATGCAGVRVLVVTDDEGLPALLPCDVLVVADPGVGLNGAIRAGLAAAESTMRRPVQAVIPADLPALRPADLRAGLAAIGCRGAGFVPDAREIGTVLLAGPRVHPLFGGRSAARHRAAGLPQLTVDAPGLRWDADDEEALAHCRALGVGRHTRGVLHDSGPDR